MFPALQVLVQFLKDFYNVFDTRSIEALDVFISSILILKYILWHNLQMAFYTTIMP